MPKRKQPSIVSTGIEGPNEILRGGLPASNLYMLQGVPGSGKTTAALQFLRAGVEAGESSEALCFRFPQFFLGI